MRLPDEVDGKNVRVQEAGEEADQEEEGRDHGAHREADPPEGQLQVGAVQSRGSYKVSALSSVCHNRQQNQS